MVSASLQRKGSDLWFLYTSRPGLTFTWCSCLLGCHTTLLYLFPSGTPGRDGILNHILVPHRLSRGCRWQGRAGWTGKMLSSGYTDGAAGRSSPRLVKQICWVWVPASGWRETALHGMFLGVPITPSRQLVSPCLLARKAVSSLVGPSQDKTSLQTEEQNHRPSACCSSLEALNADNPTPLCFSHTIPSAARCLCLDALADASNSFL